MGVEIITFMDYVGLTEMCQRKVSVYGTGNDKIEDEREDTE